MPSYVWTMRLLSIQNFFTAVKLDRIRLKVAAIDFGTKKVGIAVTDETRNFAFPLVHIDRKESRMAAESVTKLLKNLELLCISHKIGAIVIGFPVHPNGQWTPLCNEILTVISNAPKLNPTFLLPCTLWSEYNSTVAARQFNRDARHSLRTFKKHKDIMAASIILESFLNSKMTAFSNIKSAL